MSLEGTTVALTGGAGGMGALIARQLMMKGAEIVVVDRVDALPFHADYIRGDLGTPEGIATVAAELSARPVDVLVNLAGVQYFGPFEAQDPAMLAMGYTVNLVAPALLAQAVIPGMRARGRGQIVNVGSVFGAINFAHFVTYSSAKAGLKGLSEALRRELTGSGIAVTHVAPRAVKTPLNSAKVLEFARLTKMNMDPPELVAARIVAAIEGREKDVVIGFPESLFVRVNALLPRLVDKALAGNDRKAAGLFAS